MNEASGTGLKKRVLSGLFWRTLERIGTQGIQFIVSVILARLLMPKDYGIIGLITVFIAIANVFVQSGFGTALIQKTEVDDRDYSSVFYLGFSISLLLYTLIFFAAPSVADFFQEPLLQPILRILACSVIIGAVNNIQNTVLLKEMKFKKSFFVSLGGVFVSGAVGITMANLGHGVWSLVYSQLSGQIASTLIMCFAVRWRPRLVFSLDRLRELFKFGSNLLCSALLETIFHSLYPLIIGKLFDRTILGLYNRGQSIPAMVVNNINGTIAGVMFPALSLCQHDRVRVKELVRRMIVTSSFVVLPMMFGMAAVSRPLVAVLLTEKWLPCVPFLQMSCIAYAFWPLHTANLQAINAVGRSDIFLKLEIIKKIITVGVIVVSIPFGVYVMVGGSVILSLLSTVINAWPNRKLLDYSFREQWLDILPSLMLAAAMCGVVIAVSYLPIGDGLLLVMQILSGAAFYLAGAWLLKLECLVYLLETIKGMKKDKTGKAENGAV